MGQLAHRGAVAGVDVCGAFVSPASFDRLNLLASTENRRYFIYDNIRRAVVESGEFRHTPVDAQGSVDGRTAYVAFSDSPAVAMFDLEDREITYVRATNTGIGAFSVGLSNNVRH